MASKRRGPGEGAIFKRKDRDLWQATISVGLKPNGKRHRRTVYGKTKLDVQRKLAELQHQANHGALLDPSRLRLSEYLERWLEDDARLRVRRSTFASYRGVTRKHITPRIGGLLLPKVTALHVKNMLSEMEAAKYAASTRRHAYIILHAAFEAAIRDAILNRNPCASVTAPVVPQSEKAVFTDAECVIFLKAVRDDRLAALYILSLCTGMRQGEIYGLRWSDIDLKNARLTINRKLIEVDGEFIIEEPKTKAGRRLVELPLIAVEAIQEHRRRMMKAGLAGAKYVFCDTKGGPLRRQNVNRRSYKPLLARAGLPSIPFKNLRHSHATLLLLLGVNPKIVQERLGHSRISVTLDTYSAVLPSMQKEAAKKLDDLLSGTA